MVVWNDLDWTKVPLKSGFIDPTKSLPPIPGATPGGQAEKDEQRKDDVAVLWDGNVSAAELAYVMYQAPVMVAIHAAEMLAPASAPVCVTVLAIGIVTANRDPPLWLDSTARP